MELRFHFCGLVALLGFSIPGNGQPPVNQPDSSGRAIQLPLSGRTSQDAGVVTTQEPVPGTSTSVNTTNSSVRVTGPYSGSRLSVTPSLEPMQLSLSQALRLGIEYNLGAVGSGNATRLALGQQRVTRSALLPNIDGSLFATVQQLSLASFGLMLPGVPTVVGPFNYFDARASLSQTIADLTALHNNRAAREGVRAAEFSASDARDLVALAVSGTYLQVVAAAARIDSARAQVASAEAVYQQAVDRHRVGLNARIDVTRTQVELQTQRQRLTTIETDWAKRKIALTRLVGLSAGQEIELIDNPPFTPLAKSSVDEVLTDAYRNRADLKAAEAQVSAAEQARNAARAERLPSLHLDANYGAIGVNPSRSSGTMAVAGSIRFPIWEGGRIAGEVLQADAALSQRRAEHEDLRGRVDADVRNAFLDLRAAADQVRVAESNVALAQDTLRQARDRFGAGVSDTVEVVQAQETLATAELDYISSLYAHNLGKVTLARAVGRTQERIQEFLSLR